MHINLYKVLIQDSKYELSQMDKLNVSGFVGIVMANIYLNILHLHPTIHLHIQLEMENMKWLKHGCLWDSDTFKYAAENGKLENMKWLKEQGCPWTSLTFTYAVSYGNMENMKWLKEQVFIRLWNELVVDIAPLNYYYLSLM